MRDDQSEENLSFAKVDESPEKKIDDIEKKFFAKELQNKSLKTEEEKSGMKGEDENIKKALITEVEDRNDFERPLEKNEELDSEKKNSELIENNSIAEQGDVSKNIESKYTDHNSLKNVNSGESDKRKPKISLSRLEKSHGSESEKQSTRNKSIEYNPYAMNTKQYKNVNNQKVIQYKLEEINSEEFLKRIHSYEPFIQKYILSGISPKQTLTELMCLCRIVPRPESIENFPKEISKVIQLKLKSAKKKQEKISKKGPENFSNILPLDQSIFIEALKIWYENIHNPKDLQSKLKISIKEYELMKQKMLPSEDHSFIDSLISILKTQYKKVNDISIKNTENLSFQEKAKKGAHEIFLYYAKFQNSNLGQVQMKKKFDQLSLFKFLQFTKDFGILEEHRNESKNRIKQTSLEKIFERNSENNKKMLEYQFFQSLENIAVIFFDEEYDVINKLHWKLLPDSEKVLKLYEVLGFHEPALYVKRLKDYKPKLDLSVNSSRNLFAGTPRTKKNNALLEKIPEKTVEVKKLSKSRFGSKESKSEKKEIPMTLESLSKMEGDDEMAEFIDENNSSDEFHHKNNKLANSISAKILKRAEELEKVNKMDENLRVSKIMRASDEKLARFSRKLNK